MDLIFPGQADLIGFKEHMKNLFELTQKSQDLQTLEKSPFVVFVELFQNSFNKNSVNRKDYNTEIMKKWESCPIEIRELCLSKSLKISERNAGWQKVILDEILFLKKTILAQAVMLPTQVTASDDPFFIFAELEKVEPKIFCRFPNCKSSFTEKGTRVTHERTLHRRKFFSCRNCDFFAENLANIENHNFRYHHAAKEKISERVTDEQFLETCARPEVYFDVAIVEPFQHEVDKVLVTENITTEELIFQQPQTSCFDDDDWEPESIDESPCQQETINVAPRHSEAIGDVSAVEYQEYVFHIEMRIRNRIARFDDYDLFLTHLFQFCGVLYKKQDICGINGTLIGPDYPPENFRMSVLQDSENVGQVTVLLKSSRNNSLSSSTPQLKSKVIPIGSVSSNANVEALPSTSKYQKPIPALSDSKNATNDCVAKKTTSALHSLLRFYHVKREVTFDHIADFCSQCGKVVFIKEIEKEKWLVEIAVDQATADAFVAKQGKTCRINNSRCVVASSIGTVIFGKTVEWQNKIDAYHRKKSIGG